MRDMVTCFSEHAIRISETTCSLHYTHPPSSSISQQKLIPSVQETVISTYRIILSTKKQQLITVTWCNKDPMGIGGLMTLSFSNDPSTSTILKLNPFSRFFKKKKGSKSFEFEDNTKMEIFWDLSTANYGSGPEPINKYYVILVIDSELGLILGDRDFLAEAAVARKQLLNYKGRISNKMAKSTTLISRREHYGSSGNPAIYCSTKAKFVDTGNVHDICIRCSSCGENDRGVKQPEPAVLSVSIDKKIVLRVKRLRWNFRGNQTIFIDGLLVDLFWDVHDWLFFNPSTVRGGTMNGYHDAAVFMFRKRSGMESRLWLLEDHKVTPKKEQHNDIDFSLLICASK